MIKFVISLSLLIFFSTEVGAQDYYPEQGGARRHHRQAFDRTVYNYFKASMGWSSVDTHRDVSGELEFKDNTILPIHLSYGFTAGNAAFEAELGFSNNEFDFTPFDSIDEAGFGDMASSKLMFNGFYKSSATSSNFYIGGGFGFVSVSLDGVEDALTGSAFAAQFIAGGEIRTTERSGIFIEYKNIKTIGLELENDFALLDYNFQESSLNIGMKLYF